MSLCHFLNDAVRSQQANPTGYSCGESASFFFILGFGWIEQATQVPVAKAVEEEFAVSHGLEQSGVRFGQRIESPHSPSLPGNRTAQSFGQFAQWLGFPQRREGICVTLVALLRDFCSSAQINYSLAELEPFLPPAFISLFGAEHFHVPRIVDDGLDARALSPVCRTS